VVLGGRAGGVQYRHQAAVAAVAAAQEQRPVRCAAYA